MSHMCSICVQMPEMKLTSDLDRKFYRFGLQNMGMLLGFTIMVILAVFEDSIRNIDS